MYYRFKKQKRLGLTNPLYCLVPDSIIVNKDTDFVIMVLKAKIRIEYRKILKKQSNQSASLRKLITSIMEK